MNDVSAVLNRAARILETKGWMRKDYTNANQTRFCVLGATHKAHHRLECALSNDPVCAEAEGYLAGAVGVGVGEIGEWNDRQKSKRPVIAALRNAAIAAKRQKRRI